MIDVSNKHINVSGNARKHQTVQALTFSEQITFVNKFKMEHPIE